MGMLHAAALTETCVLHAPADGVLEPIKMTASTGVAFKLVMDSITSDAAEDFCKGCCGHLAAYTSQQEQFDVENFYVAGVLGAHPSHMGWCFVCGWCGVLCCAGPAYGGVGCTRLCVVGWTV
jgi:hypothetical protein